MAKNKKPMMPKQITERIFEIWAKFIQYILVTVPVTSLLCLDFVQVFWLLLVLFSESNAHVLVIWNTLEEMRLAWEGLINGAEAMKALRLKIIFSVWWL